MCFSYFTSTNNINIGNKRYDNALQYQRQRQETTNQQFWEQRRQQQLGPRNHMTTIKLKMATMLLLLLSHFLLLLSLVSACFILNRPFLTCFLTDSSKNKKPPSKSLNGAVSKKKKQHPSHRCVLCGTVTSSTSNHRRHLKNMHIAPMLKTSSAPCCPFWNCRLPLYSATPAALEKHLDREHGIEGYTAYYCKIDGCDAILEDESMLEIHMLHEHWLLCN